MDLKGSPDGAIADETSNLCSPDSETALTRTNVVIAGHTGDLSLIRKGRAAIESAIRAAALNALIRTDTATFEDLLTDLESEHLDVSSNAAERSAVFGPSVAVDGVLVRLLSAAPDLAEVSAWALGERHQQHESEPGVATPGPPPELVAALGATASGHADALVRESAVAALGCIADPASLATVLAACNDKATVRRRAIIALAAFEGPEVEAALAEATSDRDWQVRQAAEDLLA